MSFSIRRLNTRQRDFETQFAELLDWSNRENPDVVRQAQRILEAVPDEGDEALLRFTRDFDRRTVKSASELSITRTAMAEGWERLPLTARENLQLAADRIYAYHDRQRQHDSSYTDEYGNQLGVRFTPLARVGVYVPGGQASYPSTVLMTLLPAKVAGVSETVVTVPTPADAISDHLLAALYLVEPPYAFTIGGAQAIAALTFGAETIPKVDKIVGPGGEWVATAKKLVFGPVGIESIAGPSEILVVADGSVEPLWTAWDLMSQAEHDVSAQAILVSPSAPYLDAVSVEVEKNLTTSARATVIKQSLAIRGALIQTQSLDEAIDIANRIAPEHLQLAVENPRDLLKNVKHAGAIFLGQFSAEARGDYVAGPSHVLPTFGTARYASVLSVQDFVNRTSLIDISESGAQVLGRVAGGIAEVEGLHAHAQAARVRVHNYNGTQ